MTKTQILNGSSSDTTSGNHSRNTLAEVGPRGK